MISDTSQVPKSVAPANHITINLTNHRSPIPRHILGAGILNGGSAQQGRPVEPGESFFSGVLRGNGGIF